MIIWIILIVFLLYNPVSVRIMTVFTALVNNIDSGIFYNLVATESSFNSFAVSRNEVFGLGQVKPSTAKYIFRYYVPGMLWIPPLNLHIAALYYNYLLKRFGNNHSLSLAAYNWGETNVENKLRQENISIETDKNYRELFRNVPETYHYIGATIKE